jgi:hypothetical protein
MNVLLYLKTVVLFLRICDGSQGKKPVDNAEKSEMREETTRKKAKFDFVYMLCSVPGQVPESTHGRDVTQPRYFSYGCSGERGDIVSRRYHLEKLPRLETSRSVF